MQNGANFFCFLIQTFGLSSLLKCTQYSLLLSSLLLKCVQIGDKMEQQTQRRQRNVVTTHLLHSKYKCCNIAGFDGENLIKFSLVVPLPQSVVLAACHDLNIFIFNLIIESNANFVCERNRREAEVFLTIGKFSSLVPDFIGICVCYSCL